MILRPILESMLEEIKFEDLPSNWSFLDVESFSSKKKLWDFQQDAVKNAIKCLYLFYKQDNLVKIFKFFLRLRFISKMGGEYSELSCSLAMKEKYKLSVFQALLEL